MSGLYPEDPLQALYCDEILGALEDLNHYIVQTFGLEGEALKQAREKLMSHRLVVYVKAFEELLQRGGGQYFADGRLTICDLKMLAQLTSFRSGNLDHIPADFIDKLAPALVNYQAHIEKEPLVVAYYESLP